MAKKKTKTTNSSKPKLKVPSFKLTNQQKLVLGSFLVLLGLLLFIAFVSFLFTGKADQSTLTEFTSRDVKPQNWLNKTGAWLSDFFIQRGFGIASFIFAGLIFLSGVFVLTNSSTKKLRKHWFWGTLIVIWLAIFFGFFTEKLDILGGTIGFEMNLFLQDYLGKIGTSLLLVFFLITYLAIRFKVTADTFKNLFQRASKDIKNEFNTVTDDVTVPIDNDLTAEAEDIKSAFELDIEKPTDEQEELAQETKPKPKPEPEKEEAEMTIEVEKVAEELSETDNLSNKLVEDFGQFDPTLELSNYKFPSLDLLKKYESEGITINQEELEENKNRIVETLNNYKIGIASIKATIGPTV